MTFKTLGLREELIKATEKLGFQEPMPIQEKAIPELLSGERDFVGLAQTGTGKTCAFGLPMLQQINPSLARPQGIIICPTRELCIQITDDLKKFAAYMKNVNIVAVYGGASISTQMRQLKKGPQIIAATPGRLIDMIKRKAVNLSKISYAVLDEADEMLNMGFQEDIDNILGNMPDDIRVWLFSATMPSGVAAIAKNYLSNPVEINVGGKNCSPKNITHKCYMVHEKNRYQGLKRMIDFAPDIYGLVFCRTRKDTQIVAESLMQDGYKAEALHGDLSQSQRDYVMRKFRQGSVKILVATDVAARGLDVDDITHVIHYNLPDEPEVYTHRSGRTARAGKSGISMALINAKEMYRIRILEKRVNVKFDFDKIPDGKMICEKQLFGLVEKIVHTDVNHKEIENYLPAIFDALDGFDKEDLIRRFISSEFNRFLSYYHHADDINVKPGRKRNSDSRQTRRKDRFKAKNNTSPRFKNNKNGQDSRPARKRKENLKPGNTSRFFINVGRLDKINEGAIVRLICDKSGIRSGMIGDIDLNREFSFFEVEKSAAGKIKSSLNNVKLDGRPVQIQEVLKKKKQRKREQAVL